MLFDQSNVWAIIIVDSCRQLTLHYSGRHLRMNFTFTVAQWDDKFCLFTFYSVILVQNYSVYGEIGDWQVKGSVKSFKKLETSALQKIRLVVFGSIHCCWKSIQKPFMKETFAFFFFFFTGPIIILCASFVFKDFQWLMSNLSPKTAKLFYFCLVVWSARVSQQALLFQIGWES